MITKAEIQSIDFAGNTCSVRIPYFESAGVTDKALATATFSNTPGSYNGYKVGDVVLVAFENGNAHSPCVIGKLYLGANEENKDPRGSINCATIVSSEANTIPLDTKIVTNTPTNTIEVNTYPTLKNVLDTLTTNTNQVTNLTQDTQILSTQIESASNAVETINDTVTKCANDIALALADVDTLQTTVSQQTNDLSNLTQTTKDMQAKVSQNSTLISTQGETIASKNTVTKGDTAPWNPKENDLWFYTGSQEYKEVSATVLAALDTTSAYVNYYILQDDNYILVTSGNYNALNIDPTVTQAYSVKGHKTNKWYTWKNKEWVETTDSTLVEMQDNIATLTITADTINSQVASVSETLTNNYYTREETNSQINQTAENIENKVSETYVVNSTDENILESQAFGWNLTKDSWTVSNYVNGSKANIMTIDKDGMTLNGNIKITGYIKQIENKYRLLNTSIEPTTKPEGWEDWESAEWSDTLPSSIVSGKYIWCWEKITDGDNGITSRKYCLNGVKGDKGDPGNKGEPGQDGTDGKNGSSVTSVPYYCRTQSNAVIPVLPINNLNICTGDPALTSTTTQYWTTTALQPTTAGGLNNGYYVWVSFATVIDGNIDYTKWTEPIIFSTLDGIVSVLQDSSGVDIISKNDDGKYYIKADSIQGTVSDNVKIGGYALNETAIYKNANDTTTNITLSKKTDNVDSWSNYDGIFISSSEINGIINQTWTNTQKNYFYLVESNTSTTPRASIVNSAGATVSFLSVVDTQNNNAVQNATATYSYNAVGLPFYSSQLDDYIYATVHITLNLSSNQVITTSTAGTINQDITINLNHVTDTSENYFIIPVIPTGTNINVTIPGTSNPQVTIEGGTIQITKVYTDADCTNDITSIAISENWLKLCNYNSGFTTLDTLTTTIQSNSAFNILAIANKLEEGPWLWAVKDKFALKNDGTLYCTNLTAKNAKIDGNLTVTEGQLGTIQVSSSGLQSNNFTLSNEGLRFINNGYLKIKDSFSLERSSNDNAVITAGSGGGFIFPKVNISASTSNTYSTLWVELVSTESLLGDMYYNFKYYFANAYGTAQTVTVQKAQNVTFSAVFSDGSIVFKTINFSNPTTVSTTGTEFTISKRNTSVTSGTYKYLVGPIGSSGNMVSLTNYYFASTQSKYINICVKDSESINPIYSLGSLIPSNINGVSYNLGSSTNGWANIYSINSQTVTSSTASDIRLKQNIKTISSKYDKLFDILKPVTFKFKNDLIKNDSTHIGFIAQDVEDAMLEANLTSKDLGLLSISNDSEGRYSLAYQEFIALNVAQIQKLKKQVAELEVRLAILENK